MATRMMVMSPAQVLPSALEMRSLHACPQQMSQQGTHSSPQIFRFPLYAHAPHIAAVPCPSSLGMPARHRHKATALHAPSRCDK